MRDSRGARRAAVAALSLSLLSVGVVLAPLPEASAAGPACGKRLAFMGALTGDAGALGENASRGLGLAVQQYNSAHPGCTVLVEKYDTQGDPSNAVPLATQIVNTASIVGVVGPMFSGESLSTGKTFDTAGLVTVSPSATNPIVTRQGWKTFHRIVGNDVAGGPLVAKYVTSKLHAKKVAVVVDGSDYGKMFARSIRVPLGKKVVVTGRVSYGQKKFTKLIKRIKAKKATALVFGGYYDLAGPLAKQLVKAHWKGAFVSGDGVMDPAYTRAAGAKAAARTFLVSGTAPATLSPAFTQAYKTAYGVVPGIYSLEAYDATNVLLAAIGAGDDTRATVLDAVDHYDDAGLTKRIRFTSTGEVVAPPVWVYKPAGRGFTVRTKLG